MRKFPQIGRYDRAYQIVKVCYRFHYGKLVALRIATTAADCIRVWENDDVYQFPTLHKSEKGTFGYDTANDDPWRFDWPLRPVVRACTIVIVFLLTLKKRGQFRAFCFFTLRGVASAHSSPRLQEFLWF